MRCRGERARAVTAVFGSLDVGSVIGLLVCGPLIRTFGWPSVFYLFALLGLVWCLLWPLLKPEDPDTSVPLTKPAAIVSGTVNPCPLWVTPVCLFASIPALHGSLCAEN